SEMSGRIFLPLASTSTAPSGTTRSSARSTPSSAAAFLAGAFFLAAAFLAGALAAVFEAVLVAEDAVLVTVSSGVVVRDEGVDRAAGCTAGVVVGAVVFMAATDRWAPGARSARPGASGAPGGGLRPPT